MKFFLESLFLLFLSVNALRPPFLQTMARPYGGALRASPRYPYNIRRSPVTKSMGATLFAPEPFESSNAKRLSFVRKVYGLFSGQIAATFLSTLYIRNNPAIQRFLFSNFQAISSATFLGSFAVLNALLWSPRLRYQPPMNYLLLGLYTAFQSAFIGTIASAFAPQVALTASLHALTAFSALSLYAFTRRSSSDLTAKRGLFATLLASVSCVSILNIMFGTPWLHNLLSGFSATLLALYTIADTQAIISGNHAYGYGTRDHILASMSLYQHATSLFMRILEFVDRSSRKQRYAYEM